jgi:hypothetical protein
VVELDKFRSVIDENFKDQTQRLKSQVAERALAAIKAVK